MKFFATLAASVFLVSTALSQNLDWGPSDANWTDPGVWYNTTTATTATFSTGAFVVLEDTQSGTGDRTITLTSTVTPGGVTCTASKNFTISGSGAIAGTTGLAKSGAGTLTLGVASTYTGGTTVNGGQLNINYGASSDTTHSAIGTGTFTISGPCTIDNTSGGNVTIGPLLRSFGTQISPYLAVTPLPSAAARRLPWAETGR